MLNYILSPKIVEICKVFENLVILKALASAVSFNFFVSKIKFHNQYFNFDLKYT